MQHKGNWTLKQHAACIKDRTELEKQIADLKARVEELETPDITSIAAAVVAELELHSDNAPALTDSATYDVGGPASDDGSSKDPVQCSDAQCSSEENRQS